MLTPFATTEAEAIDWNAQAIFTRPLETFARPAHPLFEGEDGLDRYRAIAGRLDGVPFVIRSYRGFPAGTVELCITQSFDEPDLSKAHAFVERAMQAFAVNASDRAWRVGDDIGDPNAWVETFRSRMDAQA